MEWTESIKQFFANWLLKVHLSQRERLKCIQQLSRTRRENSVGMVPGASEEVPSRQGRDDSGHAGSQRSARPNEETPNEPLGNICGQGAHSRVVHGHGFVLNKDGVYQCLLCEWVPHPIIQALIKRNLESGEIRVVSMRLDNAELH